MIDPKTWDRIVEILGARLDSPRIVWAACVVIYALNHVLVCMRPEMAINIGLKSFEPSEKITILSGREE